MNLQHVGFLDVETTGLSPFTNDIAALAVVITEVHADGLREVDRFESLARPRRPENVTQEALDINGLSMDDLMAAPPIEEVMAALAAFLAPYGVVVPGGHNARFDLGFIRAAEEHTGIRLRLHPTLFIDTLQLAKAHLVDKKKLRNAKLTTLVEHYQIPHHAHDATSDVVATIAVCEYIAKEAPQLWHHFTTRAIFTANRLEELAALDVLRDKETDRLQATPEWAALQEAQAAYDALSLHQEVAASVQALEARRRELVEGLQRELDTEAGAITTADGGVAGYKIERSYEYSPAAVRRLLPDHAKDIIKTEEKVVFGIMQGYAKAAVKAGKAPVNVMDLLREEAKVSVKKTWSCKPGKGLDLDAALARLDSVSDAALAEAPTPDALAPEEVASVSGPAPVPTAAEKLTRDWEALGDAAPVPDVRALSPAKEDDDAGVGVRCQSSGGLSTFAQERAFAGLFEPSGDGAQLAADRESVLAFDGDDE